MLTNQRLQPKMHTGTIASKSTVQFEPPSVAGVHSTFHLQLPVPCGRRMVQYHPQRSSDGLPRAQISNQTGYVSSGIV